MGTWSLAKDYFALGGSGLTSLRPGFQDENVV